jgi:hypothetical protein
MEHHSEHELMKRLTEAASEVKVDSSYAHYRDQSKTYRVQGLIIIEATNQVGVVYTAEYGEGVTYVRPLTNWLDKLAWQGKHVQRFQSIVK